MLLPFARAAVCTRSFPACVLVGRAARSSAPLTSGPDRPRACSRPPATRTALSRHPRQQFKARTTTMAAGTNFHDAPGCRFGVKVGEDEAFVSYSINKDKGTIDLQHTFTPPALRGQGMASQVVAQAFEYAKANGYKVIPSCSYIPVFVKKNPEWSGYVN